MKTKTDTLGKHDNGKLLRKIPVESAMEFMKQDLELGKATCYPRFGRTVYSMCASWLIDVEFGMEC